MADLETILSRTERDSHGFAQEWFGVAAIIESERRSNFIEIRIHNASTIFIEANHNAQNGRASYAPSQDRQRIFGYDGVTTWHRHPLHHPEKLEPCA